MYTYNINLTHLYIKNKLYLLFILNKISKDVNFLILLIYTKCIFLLKKISFMILL